jgi:O-antigen ligase
MTLASSRAYRTPMTARQAALDAAARRALDVGERALAVVTLAVYSGAWWNSAAAMREDGGGGGGGADPWHLIVYGGAFAACLLLLTRWRDALRLAWANAVVLALPILAIVSVRWSDAPGITLRRSAALLVTALVGLYFAVRFTPRQMLVLLAWTFGITAVLSLVVGAAVPGIGRDGSDWRGLYDTKNVLGRAMALGATVFLLLARGLDRRRWIGWCGAALCALVALLAHSGTALLVLLLMGTTVMALGAYQVAARDVRLLVFAIAATLLAGGAAVLSLASRPDLVLAALGKDATLTGRTFLWQLASDMAARRPWLGYGYGAFWLGPGSWAGYVADLMHWEAPHAHNGLLDLALDLGRAGVVLYLVGYVLALRAAIARARHPFVGSALPAAYLVFLALSNITESALLRQFSVFWVLYVYATCSLAVREPETG